MKYVIYNTFDKIRRVNNNEKINLKFHSLILNRLEKEYSVIINNHKSNKLNFEADPSNVVWVMWWQGIEKAPPVVKICVNRIQQTFDQVIIIDEKNFSSYVSLDNTILEKFNKGMIGMAFFSDIMRVNLLAKHGGLWIDSTCFIKDIDVEEIFSYDFYTPKGIDFFESKYVPRGKWRGFFMQARKGYPVFCFMRDFFNEYWINENKLINFFLIDYVLEIAYKNNIGNFREDIDSLPFSNPALYSLDKALLNSDNTSFRFDEKTFVYKLNWKHDYINKECHEDFTQRIYLLENLDISNLEIK